MSYEVQDYENVTTGLSNLIRRYSVQLDTEQRCSSADADSSDDRIKELKRKILVLRQLRNDFETCISGAIIP